MVFNSGIIHTSIQYTYKTMFKVIKTLVALKKAIAGRIMPYAVHNFDLNVIHYAWTFKEAKEWQAAYDLYEFGLTFVFHWNNIVSVAGLEI